MTKLISIFAFLLFAPTFAHAVEVTVSACGQTLASGEDTDYKRNTVYEVTAKVTKAAGLGAPRTNKENNYVSAIGNFGEKETTVGGEKLLWGWNYLLNGVEYKESPMALEVPFGTKAKVEWVYGYLKMDLGKTRCTQGEQCPFNVAATAADCEDPKPGQVTEVKVGSLSGRVVDASGNPVVGATVSASRVDHGMKITEVASTDESGEWSLPSIIAATYTVTARAFEYLDSDAAEAVVSPEAPASVTLKLHPLHDSSN